jgi:hypothetical protein
MFISFAFDTFGFLALNVVSLLQRVQKVMNNNVVSSRATNIIFKRICFAIQKGLATHLLRVCLTCAMLHILKQLKIVNFS